MDTRKQRRDEEAPPSVPPEHFRGALLRNRTRRCIQELLSRHPGMNKHQLAKAIGISFHSIDFHIGRMQEYGLVEDRPAATNDREALWFTRENVDLWDNRSTRILFGRGAPRPVAAYLATHPGANVAELSKALDLAATTVRRHLRILRDAQLIQQLRIDHDVIYHAEPELAEWISSAWPRDRLGEEHAEP